jgi:peptidoglycan/xylan/chitin deacetylase (PgdA/CDA1 family)
MYHRLGPAPLPGREAGEDTYAVTEETFGRQMSLLAEARCPVVPFDSVARPRTAADLPARAVALTFDDGNASDYRCVLPILRQHGYLATFFITPSWMGADGYMTWDEVRELRSAGMTIGAHGLDHTLLSTLDGPALTAHLEAARHAIAAELGTAPVLLSLPGGAGGRRAVTAARGVGFELVATSVPRVAAAGPSPDGVPRFAVPRADTLPRFRALIERAPGTMLRHALRHRTLGILRVVVGEGAYARVRRSATGR